MEENVMVAPKKKGVTGTTLKIIAIVAMFIDHFAAIFVESYLTKLIMEAPADIIGDSAKMMAERPDIIIWEFIMLAMRAIGRFGFPIFAFLLVEGFTHTRSVKKYALNLGIFALISELPFNLGFAKSLIYPGYQNVFFTLLLGLLCLWSISELAEKRQWSEKLAPLYYVAGAIVGAIAGFELANAGVLALFTTLFYGNQLITVGAGAGVGLIVAAAIGGKFDAAAKNRVTFTVLPITVFMTIAYFLKTDYADFGVLTIVIMYLLRKSKNKAFAWGCALLTLMSPLEVFAFFMLIPVSRYNGERGKKMNKYFFYAFYPVHIGLIYLLTLLVGFTTFSLGF